MGEIGKALIVCGCIASVAGGGSAAAAELQARTSQAYETYLEAAQRAFVARVRAGSDPSGPGRTGTISAGPGGQDGIITVPGGLVHHWIGRTLLRGVTLEHVVRVSASYADLQHGLQGDCRVKSARAGRRHLSGVDAVEGVRGGDHRRARRPLDDSVRRTGRRRRVCRVALRRDSGGRAPWPTGRAAAAARPGQRIFVAGQYVHALPSGRRRCVRGNGNVRLEPAISARCSDGSSNRSPGGSAVGAFRHRWKSSPPPSARCG